MYKLDLPVDLKEQAAIERRRRLEKERQARIFNNKFRLIGVITSIYLIWYLKSSSKLIFFSRTKQVDKNALDQQITDKNFMDEMEKKRSEAYGNRN